GAGGRRGGSGWRGQGGGAEGAGREEAAAGDGDHGVSSEGEDGNSRLSCAAPAGLQAPTGRGPGRGNGNTIRRLLEWKFHDPSLPRGRTMLPPRPLLPCVALLTGL